MTPPPRDLLQPLPIEAFRLFMRPSTSRREPVGGGVLAHPASLPGRRFGWCHRATEIRVGCTKIRALFGFLYGIASNYLRDYPEYPRKSPVVPDGT